MGVLRQAQDERRMMPIGRLQIALQNYLRHLAFEEKFECLATLSNNRSATSFHLPSPQFIAYRKKMARSRIWLAAVAMPLSIWRACRKLRHSLRHRHEAVDHTLGSAGLKRDFELVAFLVGDRAIAELLVEHARANRDVAARLGSKAGGAAAGFLNAGRARFISGGERPLPAGPARSRTLGPRPRHTRKRGFALAPA